MSHKVAITVFPGSNCEQDVLYALRFLGAQAEYVWHLDTDLSGFAAVVVPGGFAYGDYLRTGAIAAFSPVMQSVRQFAAAGGPVLGICNGFQILCEAGMLPGVLRRNRGLKFRCTDVFLTTGNGIDSPFTSRAQPGRPLRIPINHFEGNYYCAAETVADLERTGRIAFRYCGPNGAVTPEANPNGATANIAGVLSEAGNVLGMMPHPERAVDPAVGGTDGQSILISMTDSLANALT